MYNKKDTLYWQNLTQELLTEQKGAGIAVKDIEALRGVLRFHEYRYYVLNEPSISDVEYDSIYKKLEQANTCLTCF